MIIVYAVAVLPQDIASTYDYMKVLKQYGGVFYILILPVLLLILDNLKRRKQI